jgi:hypothetical protein
MQRNEICTHHEISALFKGLQYLLLGHVNVIKLLIFLPLSLLGINGPDISPSKQHDKNAKKSDVYIGLKQYTYIH